MEKDDQNSIQFLNKLKAYQERLSIHQNHIKNFPIVNVHSIFENSTNINQTFFLYVNGKVNWIFKPSSENRNGYEMVQAECTASRLNYHGLFPIPLTLNLKIKNWEGSAQMFIANSETLDQVNKSNIPIERDNLHRLVIFDLLFANNDRNSMNFLFQKLGGLYKIVGIDHDSSLMCKDIRELKLEYLNLEPLNHPLDEKMTNLFSNTTLEYYKQIMQENGIPQIQIEWLDSAAEELNKAFIEKTPLREVIEMILLRYNEELLSY